MAVSPSVNNLDLSCCSVWLEVLCMIFFVLGFLVCRRARSKQPCAPEKPATAEGAEELLYKTIEAEIDANNTEAALAMWRATKAYVSTPPETLCLIVQALLDADPKALVSEVIEHMEVHSCDLQNSVIAADVLEVVAQQGEVQIMEKLFHTMILRLNLTITAQLHEILISGYATSGNAEQLAKYMAQIRSQGHKLTIRAYSLAIKGLLEHKLVDVALVHMQEMRQQGLVVPPFAVTQLLGVMVARSSANLHGVLDKLQQYGIRPNLDAIAGLCQHCMQRRDCSLARRVEDFARNGNSPFCLRAYDALLSVYASSGDFHAIALFKEMKASSVYIAEGLCVRLLRKCAESRFIDFADEIWSHSKNSLTLTLPLYFAALQFYAQSGQSGQAHELYGQMLHAGIEPDEQTRALMLQLAAR